MDEGEANLCSHLKKQNKTKTCIKTRKQWFSKQQHEARRPGTPERGDTDGVLYLPRLLPWENFQVSALKRGTKAEPGRLPN